MKKERWRDVVGYEHSYQVSNLGRVRSLDRVVAYNVWGKIVHSKRKGKILSANLMGMNNGRGWLAVKLTGRNKYVHQLVLEAWIGPRPDGMQACHNNGDSFNNSVGNLRWDTPSNNMYDSVRHGTHKGSRRRVRRNDGVEFDSLRKAAQASRCEETGICKVCRGRLNTTGGYHWTYI